MRCNTCHPFIAGIAVALLGIFPVVCLGAERARAQERDDRPNIVVMFVDDMNYEGPSCYGGRWGLKTPNIDRLAAEGVRCTAAYVSAPTCGPS